MPDLIRHPSADPCSTYRTFGHPCNLGAAGHQPQPHHHPQLMPSIYQAALAHAGAYNQHGRSVSHTPWEAVTFVAVSAIVLVAYIAVLGYLATRALCQVPTGGNNNGGSSLPGGLLDTRIVYNARKGTCHPPLPAELVEPPQGAFDV